MKKSYPKKKKIKTKSSELYVGQMCESWEGNVIKIWKSSVSKSLPCILFYFFEDFFISERECVQVRGEEGQRKMERISSKLRAKC